MMQEMQEMFVRACEKMGENAMSTLVTSWEIHIAWFFQ